MGVSLIFKSIYHDIFSRSDWKVWTNSENISLIQKICEGVDIWDLTTQFGLEPRLEDVIEIIRHCRTVDALKRRFVRLGPDEALFLKKYYARLIPQDFANILNVSLPTVLSHAQGLGISFDAQLRYECAKNTKANNINRKIESMTPKDAVNQLVNYMKGKKGGENVRSMSQDYIGFRRLKEEQQKAVMDYLVKKHFEITEKKLLTTKNKNWLINTKKLDEIDYTICMHYRAKRPNYPTLYQIFETVYPSKTKFWEYKTDWNDRLIVEAVQNVLDKNQIPVDQNLPKVMNQKFFINNGLIGLWNSIQKKRRKGKGNLTTAFIILDITFPGKYKVEQFDKVPIGYWSLDQFKNQFKEKIASFLKERSYLESDISSHYLKQIQKKIYQNIKHQYPTRARKILRQYADDVLNENMPIVNKNLNIERVNRTRLSLNLKKAGRNFERCEVCGLKEPLEIHHIIPVEILKKRPQIAQQMGLKTQDDIENLIVLCENHHGIATKYKFYEMILKKKIKHSRLMEEILEIFKSRTNC